MCPAQEHIYVYIYMFLTVMIMSMTVLLSLPRRWSFCPCVCDVGHTYLHFGLCCRKFVLFLFGESPAGVCTARHGLQHAGVVHMYLQADGNVDIEGTKVLWYAAYPAMIIRCVALFWCFLCCCSAYFAYDIFYELIGSR